MCTFKMIGLATDVEFLFQSVLLFHDSVFMQRAAGVNEAQILKDYY